MIRLCAVLLFVFGPATIWSQAKPVAAPSADAPRAEQEKWLVQAITKYGSYDAMTASVKLSAAKINGCVLSYTQTKKFGATKEQTLIVTTRTDSVKEGIAIDLAKLDVSSLKLLENVSPDVMSLAFRTLGGGSVRDTEIILRQPAADAVKTAIERVARACQP